ncbi:tetratricopeptide repeat protein [Methylosinus sp. KRF6]|uniref:tetratricopeptide repeat protein n=1 Tax=Methylosinus sp. KRF6 TaxID=2846853 RepID=UPI001C0C397C|nr:tetratricopeptide repeat protein [Methylosinus sp. KRF6]MBU3887032.1 tetratricopeptide repeat protein [Methylosinus sp. KRF6]
MTQQNIPGGRHPDYIRAILDRAVKMIGEGLLDSAEVLLGTLSNEPSTREVTAHLLGVIAMRRMETSAAQLFFKAALEANPHNAEAHAQLGALLLDERPVAAAAAFAAALTIDARNPDWHVGLATAFQRLGFDDLARDNLADALALSPDHSEAAKRAAAETREIDELPQEEDEALLCDALFAEGTRRQAAGELARAAAIFERILTRAPEHAFTLCNFGALRRVMGDLDASEALLEQAIAIDPNLAPARLALAETHMAAGRDPEARAQFETAIELEPKDAAARAAYAMALQKMGAVQESIPHFHHAILLDQNRPAEFYAALGSALQAMGMRDRAEIALRHAAALAQAQ